MCLLCVHIQRDLLTPLEIARNFKEMTFEEPDHWVEVLVELEKKSLTELVSKALSDINRGEAK